MFVVFLLVHLFFTLGFYVLGSYFLAGIFGVLSVAGAIFFSPIRFSKNIKNNSQKIKNTEIAPDTPKIFSKKSYTTFFQKNILTLAVGLFYLAITGIIWSVGGYFGEEFSFTFLCFLSLVLLISLGVRFARPQGLGIYENIFLLNLIGVGSIGTLVILFATPMYKITTLFFLSIFISNLLLQAYRQVAIKKINIARVLFLVALLEIVLFLEILISPMGIGHAGLFLVLGIIWFEAAALNSLGIFRSTIRSTSLILVYSSTLFLWYFFVTQDTGFWGWLLLAISVVFNFYVHRRFENYPSLIFTAITPYLLVWIYFLPPATLGNYILYCIFIGGGGTLFGRIFRTKYMYDEYIFQTIAIGALLVSTGFYFFTTGFEGIFQISSILLMFSGILFISFLQIRKK